MKDLRLKILKLCGSKHLDLAILLLVIVTFLMRAHNRLFPLFPPWWMPVLGGLYPLNLTLIAAKGRLSAPSDSSLWPESEKLCESKHPQKQKRWSGWKVKRIESQGGRGGRLRRELHWVSEISPWAWSFNWGLAHSKVQYSALHSFISFPLLDSLLHHPDIQSRYELPGHWYVIKTWKTRLERYDRFMGQVQKNLTAFPPWNKLIWAVAARVKPSSWLLHLPHSRLFSFQ